MEFNPDEMLKQMSLDVEGLEEKVNTLNSFMVNLIESTTETPITDIA